MKKILVEKYRPKSISDYVFQNKDNERKIKKWLKEKNIPHVLMSGTPGTGKTTMSRILVNELGIDNTDVLMMNASLMRLEDIRGKVVPFVGKSAFSPFKVVQLEECLHEDEVVMIGNLDDRQQKRIGDLPIGEKFAIPSINMETGELENDTGEVIVVKEDELYEIELVDGRTIKVTEDHPMLVLLNGKIVEKTIKDGLCADDELIVVW